MYDILGRMQEASKTIITPVAMAEYLVALVQRPMRRCPRRRSGLRLIGSCTAQSTCGLWDGPVVSPPR